MKLVLAVDAIAPPLTGIGRYTWELMRRYKVLPRQTVDVRFFSAGRWIEDPEALLATHRSGALPLARSLSRHFRAPARLRRWCDARIFSRSVFHSPNYFLPPRVEGGIITVHDLSVFKFPETHPIERVRHFETAFASTLRRAAHIVTDSEATRLELAEFFGMSVDDITAIALGVSENFRPRAAQEIAQTLAQNGLTPGGYSLCVSTLEPRKRVDRLLAAYREIPTALRLRFPLVLIGSKGWLSGGLLEDIERGKREGWLRYLGFVPEADLPLLYAGAHAFMFPSAYEGFGLPVLEALASGVPTLTSNRTSLPEVAGGAAWLVEPDDHDALKYGIEHVLADDAWRREAIAKGIQSAARFNWDRCARNTLALCQRFA